LRAARRQQAQKDEHDRKLRAQVEELKRAKEDEEKK
jgi:hypothetical protein